MPTLQVSIRDPSTDVMYRVFAYRPLTRQEALRSIAAYNRAKKRKPKRGSVVDIVTTYGFQDSAGF